MSVPCAPAHVVNFPFAVGRIRNPRALDMYGGIFVFCLLVNVVDESRMFSVHRPPRGVVAGRGVDVVERG
jgi:hypothetical protein